MRLPETKIKEAIVHPEKLVRQEALLYFAGCYSRDAEVMPLAIKTIETYGRSSAFLDVHLLAQLAQTKATVQWAIRELHKEEDEADDHDIYFPALSQLLCNAALQLVTPDANDVLQASGFSLVPEFQERLQLATYDAEQCWNAELFAGIEYSRDLGAGQVWYAADASSDKFCRFRCPMTITITLPAATEARLRAEAEATGKDPGTLVLEAVEARLWLAKLRLRDVLGPVHEDFRKGGMTEAELDALHRDTLSEARLERKPAGDSPA
jgi:hypothetical protein